MEAKPVIQIIAGKPPADPEVREKWRKWVAARHVPHLLEYKGLKGAVHYKRVLQNDSEPDDDKYPEQITLFEFYSREDAEAFESSALLKEAIEDGLATWPADIGYTKVWNVFYEETQRWEK
jgi:hypothetical protein